MHGRRFSQKIDSLKDRLADEAAKLRKEAKGTHPGIERERLVRRARQAETGSHISEWLRSEATMSLNLKRLSLTNARLEVLTRTEANLQAQFLELMELREQVRTTQLSADRQSVARARKPAPVVITAAA